MAHDDKTSFEVGQKVYVMSNWGMRRTSIEKITKRNTRGGLRLTLVTSMGNYGASGHNDNGHIVARTPELDEQYAREQAMNKIRGVVKDKTLQHLTLPELQSIAEAITKAQASAKGRAPEEDST